MLISILPMFSSRNSLVSGLTFKSFSFFFFFKIYLFIFDCSGSSLLPMGFLWLWQVGAALTAVVSLVVEPGL